MTIKVNRNLYLPEFQGQPYFVILSENEPVGASVFTAIARDRDIQVSAYYDRDAL